MRIGQMAERTGVPGRMLRYYEEQRLIEPGRDTNGYRVYCEEGVRRIGQIRALADAGVPVRFIKLLLADAATPGETADGVVPRLVEYAGVLQTRIDDMTRRRQALLGYIAELTSRPAPLDPDTVSRPNDGLRQASPESGAAHVPCGSPVRRRHERPGVRRGQGRA